MSHDDKPRVLMIDDDPDFQMIVRAWLADRYEHIALSGGEDLLEQLSGLEPDLVILDVQMPGPDGFRLCRRIRGDARFVDLPVVFLTGCKEDEAFIKNLDVCGTAFLTKPVERKRLLALLGELVPSSKDSRGA